MDNTWTSYGILQGRIGLPSTKEYRWMWYDDRDRKWKEDIKEFYEYKMSLHVVSSGFTECLGTGTDGSASYTYSNGRTDSINIDPEVMAEALRRYPKGDCTISCYIQFPPPDLPTSRFELMEI